ncbi:hypothetical protein GX408_06370, partial [bacterium]|nr:hypothetical protein [bacterium]
PPEWNADGTVRYRTPDGDVMQFSFNGPRKLNGRSMAFSEYKFFNSPYITSELGSRIITLQYKKKKLALDFRGVDDSQKKE